MNNFINHQKNKLINNMIKNKTALITGGANGIGLTTSLLFNNLGAKVIVLDNAKNLTSIKKKILKKGINIDFHKVDISKIHEIKKKIKIIEKKYKSIDILILNAAICPFREFLKIDEKIFDDVVNTNQKGAFFLAQYVSQNMVKKKVKGKIVFLSSVSSIFGGSLQAHYCATKGAINQIMKSMAISLGKYKINVNAVLPGTVITNLNRKQLEKNKKLKKYFINRTPLKRLITPSEIAKAILFLSCDMSSGVNGETLVVDGGMTINFQ